MSVESSALGPSTPLRMTWLKLLNPCPLIFQKLGLVIYTANLRQRLICTWGNNTKIQIMHLNATFYFFIFDSVFKTMNVHKKDGGQQKG